jgi:hypothetical protein
VPPARSVTPRRAFAGMSRVSRRISAVAPSCANDPAP